VWSWRKVSATKAKGHSYLAEHRAGATASWSFTGRSVSWLTVTGPSFGRADVYVDGKKKATFNNYASANHYGVARTVKGLSAAKHTVKIRVTGRKGSRRGTDTVVAVDGFKVGTKVTASPALKVSWSRVATAKALAGGYARADLAGAGVSFTFRGTRVDWVTETGRTFGKARVYVDGKLRTTVDNFAKVSKYRVVRAFSGLADKRHTLRIVALGKHRSGATGNYVALDGWVVH
jgi:hypothetical protein